MLATLRPFFTTKKKESKENWDMSQKKIPKRLQSWQRVSKTYFPYSGEGLCLQSKIWLSFIK